MRMAKGGAFLAVAVIWGAVSSCADAPSLPSADSFCGRVCEGVVRCDSRASWQLCNNSCVSDPGSRSLVSIRPEAAAIAGSCVSALDCTTIFNGPFEPCWDRAREETPPSPHLIAFCPAYSTSAFECGYWFSVEECQARLTIWTDKFLDALAACTREATCEATDACLENRFAGN